MLNLYEGAKFIAQRPDGKKSRDRHRGGIEGPGQIFFRDTEGRNKGFRRTQKDSGFATKKEQAQKDKGVRKRNVRIETWNPEIGKPDAHPRTNTNRN